MTREEIENDRQYQLTGAAIDYCRKELSHYDGEALGEITDAFEAGAEWADSNPNPEIIKRVLLYALQHTNILLANDWDEVRWNLLIKKAMEE